MGLDVSLRSKRSEMKRSEIELVFEAEKNKECSWNCMKF